MENNKSFIYMVYEEIYTNRNEVNSNLIYRYRKYKTL